MPLHILPTKEEKPDIDAPPNIGVALTEKEKSDISVASIEEEKPDTSSSPTKEEQLDPGIL